MDKVLHASEKMDWQTPAHVVELVARVFGGAIHYDPCTTSENPCHAQTFSTPDGISPLGVPYWPARFYCNPPYGVELRRKGGWADTIRMQSEEGIVLVPSRTETKWFNSIWDWSTLACFIEGRLTFAGAKNSAPFPSAVFYHGPQPRVFASVFSEIGRVV